MTREDALTELNLSGVAGDDDIERAYRRMVRRYPPEFNPERFQKIDDAYRFLSSLSDMMERLLSPSAATGVSVADFRFSMALDPGAAEAALASLMRSARLEALWPTKQKKQSNRRDQDCPF